MSDAAAAEWNAAWRRDDHLYWAWTFYRDTVSNAEWDRKHLPQRERQHERAIRWTLMRLREAIRDAGYPEAAELDEKTLREGGAPS